MTKCTELQDYPAQSFFNSTLFLNNVNFATRLDALMKLGEALDEQGIKWALGYSTNLFFRGIIDNFNDFDIMISSERFSESKLLVALEKAGMKIYSRKNAEVYTTKWFGRAMSPDQISIDLIVDFGIKFENNNYIYEFEKDNLSLFYVDKFPVKLVSPEEQFILYNLHYESGEAARAFKIAILRNYLKQIGVRKEIFFRSYDYLSKSIQGRIDEVVSAGD